MSRMVEEMKNLYVLFILSLVSGCGGTYEVKGIPSEIKHTVNINLDQLLGYCSRKCEQQYGGYPDYVQTCTDECIDNLVEMLGNLSGGSNAP
jgi:hypothetical protein